MEAINGQNMFEKDQSLMFCCKFVLNTGNIVNLNDLKPHLFLLTLRE